MSITKTGFIHDVAPIFENPNTGKRTRKFALVIRTVFQGNEKVNYIEFTLPESKLNTVACRNEVGLFHVGDKVQVNFDIYGNKFEKDDRVNYYNTLMVFNVEKAS
jgi:hypothetical protein